MTDRILVTGGAGFIGSHLMERLLKEGANVICLDNFDSYYDPSIKYRNIALCRESPRFTLIRKDIRDKDLSMIFCREKPSIVVHLAAMAGVRPSMQKPLLFEDVNVRGTLKVLEACRDAEVGKIVFASSSSVYGDTKKIPFREDDERNYPVSVYGATKMAGEYLCRTYHHLHGMDITCLRFFTAYGPRQRPDMAIHKFTKCIDKGEKIPLYGDGSSRRDYTYINDIVDGIIRAIKKVKGFEVYNLGESQSIELGTLVKILEKYMGKKARVKKMPPQPGDPYITYADISKAKRKLGYHPKVGIEKGLKNFVDWYCARTKENYC